MNNCFRLSLRSCIFSLLLCLNTEVLSKPLVLTYVGTPRTSSQELGVKFLINGQYTYNIDWKNAAVRNWNLNQIQAAGIDHIVHDVSNWGYGTIQPNTVNQQLALIEPEIAARGMKQAMLIAANSPSNPLFGSADIDLANRNAKWVWDNYAQLNTAFIYKGKPLIVIYAPKKSVFEAAYNSWPQKGSSTDYLNKFTIRTCFGGGWGWGLSEQAPDNHARFIKPRYVENTNLHWKDGHHRMSPQAWRDEIAWGLQANDILILSAYDDYADGSFWAIADTTGVPASSDPRRCNEDWNPAITDAYYNPIVTLIGKAPEATIYLGDEGRTFTFNSPVDIAYGVDGGFKWKYAFTGSVTFNNSSFGGDPKPGIPKYGFTRPSVESGATYLVKNRKSGKVLDIQNASSANGANAHQWSQHSGSNQRWTISHVGNGNYEFINQNSGSALHVAGGSTQDGGNVVQWIDNNLNHQRWKVVHVAGPFYKIINLNSNKALGVVNGSITNGGNIEQVSYAGTISTHWEFVKQ